MQMDAGLDTGGVLLAHATPIGDEDTAQTLHDRLAAIGAEAIVTVLDGLVRDNLRAVAQDASGVTYASKLTKAEARLDWNKSAAELARAVRAYNPWPIAYTHYRGQPLRVWRAKPLDSGAKAPPGTVTAAAHDGIDVATGSGTLRILELQPAGGRVLTAAEFANGRDLKQAHLG
jgi:methionyl-tRNA formyltransferase